jgi:hypothetical protein
MLKLIRQDDNNRFAYLTLDEAEALVRAGKLVHIIGKSGELLVLEASFPKSARKQLVFGCGVNRLNTDGWDEDCGPYKHEALIPTVHQYACGYVLGARVMGGRTGNKNEAAEKRIDAVFKVLRAYVR